MFRMAKLGVGLLIAVVGVVLAMWLVARLPSSFNPFHERTIDRSQPAVVQSVERIGQYRAATANLQLVVDLSKDTRFVPDFIKGERTLFVAAGTVDAGVDFTDLGPDAVTVNGERTAVTVTLPAARLYPPRVDLSRSSVVDRQRGVLNRIGSLIGDGPDERDVLLLAETKLQTAAQEDPRLLQQAQDNTRLMLQALLGSLGFTSVTVTFTPPEGT